jgi:putative membrane protein
MMMMGFGVFGITLMLIFWGGLVFGAMWLVRYIFQGYQQPHSPPQNSDLNPQKILEQRYARGEITQEQFETMKQDLSN